MPVTCDQRWEDMVALKGDPDWRMCARCSHPVMRVKDEADLMRAASSGACIHAPFPQGLGLTGAAPPPSALHPSPFSTLQLGPPPPPPRPRFPAVLVAAGIVLVLALALAVFVLR